jgi:hypothetical protein
MKPLLLVWPLVSIVVAFGPQSARAQDHVRGGIEPVVASIDPTTLAYDLLVDSNLSADDPANRRFKTLPAAYAAAPEGTADKPTVIGLRPGLRKRRVAQPARHDVPAHRAFLEAVKTGKSDTEMLAWVTAHLKPARHPAEIAAWSAWLENLGPGTAKGHQWLGERIAGYGPGREDIRTYCEHLDLDDYVSFGGVG